VTDESCLTAGRIFHVSPRPAPATTNTRSPVGEVQGIRESWLPCHEPDVDVGVGVGVEGPVSGISVSSVCIVM
jgi:hypothetical protein